MDVLRHSDDAVIDFIDAWAQDYANDEWRALSAEDQLREGRRIMDAATANLRGAVDLLRDVADSGAVLGDDRLSWVEVQIDRETWGALAPYRTGGQ